MKTKSLLNLKVQLAFGAAILTMLAVGTLSYRALVVSGERDQWVGHTHEDYRRFRPGRFGKQRARAEGWGESLSPKTRG